MDNLGIGYKALSAVNPKLIYCAVSGFGQTGPESKAAAFDGMVQAMSGLMSITGHPETGPTRVGFPACDVTAGATAAFGVACALFQRTHTGKGQLVDIAMLDSMLAFIGTSVAEYTFTGKRPPQAANLSVTRKPTGDMFPTKDGFIVLAVMTDKQFGNLMREIGRPETVDDPRFANWDKRIAHSAEIKAIVTDALKADTALNWAQGRRALRQGLRHRRDHGPPAARPPHHRAEDRHAVRSGDARRQRREARAWRPLGRARAAVAGPAYRRGAARGRLRRRRDRQPEGGRRGVAPSPRAGATEGRRLRGEGT
jgi:crotonobetainyl-CoA:carnitine CoA-transferase CaiB-like acyl-CoA transferase